MSDWVTCHFCHRELRVLEEPLPSVWTRPFLESLRDEHATDCRFKGELQSLIDDVCGEDDEKPT